MLSTCALLTTLSFGAELREDLWRERVAAEAESVVREAMGLHPLPPLTQASPQRPLAMPQSPKPARRRGHPAVSVSPDGSVELRRSVWDRYMSEPRKLGQLGHASAVKDRGRVEGWRLSGIKRGSLGHSLGLRTGDIVVQVNGRRAGAVPTLLAIRKELRRTDRVDVVVRRGGATVRLSVRLS